MLSRLLTPLLRLLDKPQSTLKKLLMHGERDLPQMLVQFFLCPKLERLQMDTTSTMITSRTVLEIKLLLPKQQEKLLSTRRSLLMCGEMDGLKTLVQLSHIRLLKVLIEEINLSLMLSTKWPIPSRPPTTLPNSTDKIPLTPKKMPMPGEKEPPQAQDQSHLFKVLMIEIKDTMIHIQTWPMVSILLTPMPRLLDKLLSTNKKPMMPGEVQNTFTLKFL